MMKKKELPNRKIAGGPVVGNSASISSETYPKTKKTSSVEDSDEIASGESIDLRAEFTFTVAVLEREDDLRYGWYGFTPDWLQCCCTSRFLLATLMIIAIAQGFFVHGIVSSSWGPLHGRFHFTMFEMGLIRLMYDVGMVAGFLPVIYFDANGAKRSVLLGVGCLVMAIGALTCALPHFFVGPYDTKYLNPHYVHPPCRSHSQYGQGRSLLESSSQRSVSDFQTFKPAMPRQRQSTSMSKTITTTSTTISSTSTSRTSTAKPTADIELFFNSSELSSAEPFENTSTAEALTAPDVDQCVEAQDLNHFKYIFMIGLFLNGLGGATYFTMGIALLDESVPQRTSVLYTGAQNAALLFGTAIALVINAYILSLLYVDFNRGQAVPRGVPPSNPHWRGAWWLGMLISAAISALPALIMFGFPSQLPGAMRAHLHDKMLRDPESENEDTKDPVNTVWKSITGCLSNMTYLGLTVEQITCWFLITISSSFMPSFLKAIYGVSGTAARNISGIIVFFGMIGSILGTFMQYRLTLSIIGNLRLSLLTGVATLVFVGALLVPCHDTGFAGWAITYPVNDSYQSELSRFAPCNSKCNCSAAIFHPICYRGQHPDPKKKKSKDIIFVYFSPCFAGCEIANETGGYNCNCVPKLGTAYERGGDVDAKSCYSRKCEYRAKAAVVLFCWCALLTFFRLNPLQHSLLRCIPFKDRVVGLTMSALTARVLGAIPAPAVMGLVLFNSCQVYDRTCGKDTECQWRDENSVGKNVAIVAYAVYSLGILGLLVAYCDQRKRAKMLMKSQRKVIDRRKKSKHRGREGSEGTDSTREGGS